MFRILFGRILHKSFRDFIKAEAIEGYAANQQAIDLAKRKATTSHHFFLTVATAPLPVWSFSSFMDGKDLRVCVAFLDLLTCDFFF